MSCFTDGISQVQLSGAETEVAYYGSSRDTLSEIYENIFTLDSVDAFHLPED